MSRLLKWIRWNAAIVPWFTLFYSSRSGYNLLSPIQQRLHCDIEKEVSIHWFLCQKLIATWLRLQKVALTHFPWFRGCWCQKGSSDEKERRKGLDLWKTIFTTPISEKRPSSSLQAKKKKEKWIGANCAGQRHLVTNPTWALGYQNLGSYHGSTWFPLFRTDKIPWLPPEFSSFFSHFTSIFFNVLFF